MGEQIKAIRFDIEQVGKHVKGSKKRFTWIFSLNHKNHTIIVDFSFISGKVKVVVDRKTLLENELPTNVSFQHPFTLDGYALNILQQGQTFELRINNKVFSHLYNQVKTNTEFKKYEDEIKDIRVDETNFQGNTGKKITLNIGGVGGGMKKKNYKSTAESENWGSFGGSDMGFPNYFGEGTSVSTSSGTPQVQVKVAAKNSSSLLDEDEETKPQPPQKSQDFMNFSEEAEKPQIKKTQEIDFFGDDSSPQVSTSPSQDHLATMMKKKTSDEKEDFNTMQNLFATMNIQPGTTSQTQQPSSLDFFDEPVQNSVPQPPIQNTGYGNVNLNDFNTMQQLFATTNLGQQNTQNVNTMNNPAQTREYNFNTMGINMNSDYQCQNAFSTTVPKKKEVNPFDLLDGHIEKFKEQASKSQAPVIPPSTNNDSSNIQNVNLQDFNTMQNLFKTQNNTGILCEPQQPVSAMEFNTMQNLFQTQNNVNNTYSQPPQVQNPQIQNPQEFNTMQNLFSTQANVGNMSNESASMPVSSAFGKKSQPLEEDLL